jgi:collagenase-like PrtC family protease
MKLTVGYQLTNDRRLVDLILENRTNIKEVYFSWGDLPNGRRPFTLAGRCPPWEAQCQLTEDLRTLAEHDVGLNLLLNGNCYGEYSLSKYLLNMIGDIVDYLVGNLSLAAVTTTSPVIAEFVKANYPEVEIRASVNMGIGTIQGLDYLADYFDGYYLQRELNRDFAAIDSLKSWCVEHGKQLYFLANSGCLNHCSAHTFHDNLVAHEGEIDRVDNAVRFKGICHEYLKKNSKEGSLVRDTSFIRPEDLHLYEKWFDVAKLATRANNNPVKVVKAYLEGSYSGNLLDLLEPNHAEILYPQIIANQKFPSDFALRVGACNKQCQKCGYCEEVYQNSLVDLEKEEE